MSSNSMEIIGWYGAIGIIIVSFHKKAWQPGVLNILWGIVAIVAIFGIVLK